MLPFSPAPSVLQTSKCFYSYGAIGHINPKQPPTIENTSTTGNQTNTKSPWSNFQELDYVFQVDIIIPQELFEVAYQKLVVDRPVPHFFRVVMTLGQILQGDFFKEYIKAGSVLMLSEGHAGKDNVFALKNGHLTMFLDRESYERAGLVGQPHGAKGNRGLRSRWVVELDLNTSSMWPGKKAFDRLLYACKHVFTAPLTWLLYNPMNVPSPDPLTSYPYTLCTSIPITTTIDASLPPLGRPVSILSSDEDDDALLETEDVAFELYEWLSLIRLGSPRISSNDCVDPYLSRYQTPGAASENPVASGKVCTIRWRGFFSPTWACQTLLDAMIAFPLSKSWFAMSASSFPISKTLANEGAECLFFRPEKAPGEFLLWEIHSHE